jgi:16S rRNA C1402 (ribose-2'-O) methylase RsmI
LYIKAGLDVMTAIKKVAKDRKIPKNEVYKEYHKEEK